MQRSPASSVLSAILAAPRLLPILATLTLSHMGWAADRTVTVCLGPAPQIEFRLQFLAKDYASRVYQSISVQLRWKYSCTEAEWNAPAAPSSRNLKVIGIEWEREAPPSASRTVYAVARPYQPTGTRITLYLDRLAPVLPEPKRAAAVLGHVLAHELGHILLAHDGHTETGLMKARWSIDEQRDMVDHPMHFTSSEADTIRQTLDTCLTEYQVGMAGPPKGRRAVTDSQPYTRSTK